MNDNLSRSTLMLIKQMQNALKRDVLISVILFFLFSAVIYYTDIIMRVYHFGVDSHLPVDLFFAVSFAALIVLTLFSMKRLREIKFFFNSAVDMSRVDFLTEIFNRRALFELLEFEFNKNRRYPDEHFVFIMFDIDNFKTINDSYGHNAGDEVLKSVASTLASSIRKTDIYGRFGGDEFGVILPHSDIDSGIKVAEKIKDSVNSLEYEHKGEKFGVSLSIGVVGVPAGSHIDTMEKLVEYTDKFLYMAKQQGKNRVCYPQ